MADENKKLTRDETTSCLMQILAMPNSFLHPARYFLDKPCEGNICEDWKDNGLDILRSCVIQVKDENELPDKCYLVFSSYNGDFSKNLLTKKELDGNVFYASGRMNVNIASANWSYSSHRCDLYDADGNKLSTIKAERIFSYLFGLPAKYHNKLVLDKLNFTTRLPPISASDISPVKADISDPAWAKYITHITWKTAEVPFKVTTNGVPLLEIKDTVACYALKLLTGMENEFDFCILGVEKLLPIKVGEKNIELRPEVVAIGALANKFK